MTLFTLLSRKKTAPSCQTGRRNRLDLEQLEDRVVRSSFSTLSLASTVSVDNLANAQATAIAFNTSPTINPTQQVIAVSNDLNPALFAITPVGYSLLDDPNGGGLGSLLDIARKEIAAKASQFRSQLGEPLAGFEYSQPGMGSQSTGDGFGLYQVFQGGSIYWSPQAAKFDADRGLNVGTAGAHVILGALRDRYIGSTELGVLISDTYALPGQTGGVLCNNFLNTDTGNLASIVSTPGIGTFAVSGQIWGKWVALGAGSYGVPIGFQHDLADGTASFQDFRWGNASGPLATIVTSKLTGTHDVVGAIRDKWIDVGALKWATPTTDSTVFLATGNRLNAIVNFRHFDGNDPHDLAIGTSSRGTFIVGGEIYTAWISIGVNKFGIPISDEQDALNGAKVSRFVLSSGRETAIYWTPNRDGYGWNFVAAIAQIGTDSHFYVDYGRGRGPEVPDWTPKGGPTGFEPVPPATGSTSSPLIVQPPVKIVAVYQDSVQSINDALWATLVSPNKLQATTTTLFVNDSTLLVDPSTYASAFGAIYQGDDFTSIFGSPEAPPEFSGEPATPAADTTVRDQLQARLADLDQVAAQAGQDLQAALDAQAASAAACEQIAADLQAAVQAQTAADQALATQTAALAKAEKKVVTAQTTADHSAAAYQVQVNLGVSLQAKMDQANTAYQQALAAQKANKNAKLSAGLLQTVNQTKATLDAATKAVASQKTAMLAAEKTMNSDAVALGKASAARDVAQAAVDAATEASAQAAQALADLQTAQLQAQADSDAAQQLAADLQARCDQLAADQAEVQSELAQAEADLAAV